MENYIVSARKYRPDEFQSVIGQENITQTLKNSVSTKQIAHAYLFCGPRGVGKTTSARIFAKIINCQNLTPDHEPCNQCDSCVGFNRSGSFNIHELDAASNNSVDDIRSLIEKVRIPPQIGKYSVYIIDEVHMLSSSAFNAFLKTLEEPPLHAIFILATTEKHKILPTILSRCQVYDFTRISIENIVKRLQFVASQEGISVDSDALNIIAQKADGALRDALTIFDQIVSFSGKEITYERVLENLNVLDYEYYFKITEMLLNNQVSDLFIKLDEIISKGFDPQYFISGLLKHFRDLLISRVPDTIKLLEVGDSIREKYKKQASTLSLPFIYKAMELTNECDTQYKASSNKRLLVELTLVKIANFSQNPPSTPNTATGTSQNTSATQTQSTNTETTTSTVHNPVSQNTVKEAQTPYTHNTSKNIEVKEAPKTPMTTFSIKTTTTPTPVVTDSSSTQSQEVKKDIIPLNQENILIYWMEFAEQNIEKHASLAVTMKNCPPTLLDNGKIHTQISNDYQETEIKRHLDTIRNFLGEKLGSQRFEFTFEIREMDQQKVIYTDSDKIRYLVEQNPNFIEFKQRFGLDIG